MCLERLDGQIVINTVRQAKRRSAELHPPLDGSRPVVTDDPVQGFRSVLASGL